MNGDYESSNEGNDGSETEYITPFQRAVWREGNDGCETNDITVSREASVWREGRETFNFRACTASLQREAHIQDMHLMHSGGNYDTRNDDGVLIYLANLTSPELHRYTPTMDDTDADYLYDDDGKDPIFIDCTGQGMEKDDQAGGLVPGDPKDGEGLQDEIVDRNNENAPPYTPGAIFGTYDNESSRVDITPAQQLLFDDDEPPDCDVGQNPEITVPTPRKRGRPPSSKDGGPTPPGLLLQAEMLQPPAKRCRGRPRKSTIIKVPDAENAGCGEASLSPRDNWENNGRGQRSSGVMLPTEIEGDDVGSHSLMASGGPELDSADLNCSAFLPEDEPKSQGGATRVVPIAKQLMTDNAVSRVELPLELAVAITQQKRHRGRPRKDEAAIPITPSSLDANRIPSTGQHVGVSLRPRPPRSLSSSSQQIVVPSSAAAVVTPSGGRRPTSSRPARKSAPPARAYLRRRPGGSEAPVRGSAYFTTLSRLPRGLSKDDLAGYLANNPMVRQYAIGEERHRYGKSKGENHLHAYVGLSEPTSLSQLRQRLATDFFNNGENESSQSSAIHLRQLASEATIRKSAAYATKYDAEPLYEGIPYDNLALLPKFQDYAKKNRTVDHTDPFVFNLPHHERQHLQQFLDSFQSKIHEERSKALHAASVASHIASYGEFENIPNNNWIAELRDWCTACKEEQARYDNEPLDHIDGTRLERATRQDQVQRRCLYLHGLAGSGKTHNLHLFLGHILTRAFRPALDSKEFAWSGLNLDHACIYVQDGQAQNLIDFRADFLVFADGREHSFAVKGRDVCKILFQRPIIFVSNDPIPDDAALRRRFTCITAVGNWENHMQ